MKHITQARALRLAAAAVPLVIVGLTACGGGAPASSATAPAMAGGPTRPAVVSAGAAHLTGSLCADVATANSGIRSLAEALILRHGSRQQVSRLLAAIVATYAALGSEAPGQLKGAFATLAGYYRTVEARIGGGGQLTLSDIESASHAGVSSAESVVSRYLLMHCAG